MSRVFEDKPAVRERVPLLVGITGTSGSGKSYSALRLATGMQRVIGGDIFFCDSEARRGLHYADKFKFRHVDFQPPFGPLDYLAAIEFCVSKGAKVIVVDQLTNEHSGEGGVLDQIDKFLDEKCGDDEGKRRRMQMMAQIKPKAQRKRLNSRIVQLGVDMIFCYRAQEKVKPVPGKEPEKLGWQPDTTSPLFYDMTVRFLLAPGADGKPTVTPQQDAEKLAVKTPEMFRGWFGPGMQLDEALGEKLARWAAGDGAEPSNTRALEELIAAIEMAPDAQALETTLARARGQRWTKQEGIAIGVAKERRTAELSAQREPGSDDE